MSGKLNWRINNIANGTSSVLVPEPQRLVLRACTAIRRLLRGTALFVATAWGMGVAEPKKLIHGLKVGMALSLVSLFYYMRPLYEGVGGNAMWSIMTVVVVFEYTVGATLSKSVNRTTGTFLAGSLGVGVHWVASQSGDHLEPIVIGISVFLLASATTFSRFIPTVKTRFDYGALIFILTFSLVSVSGYRVDKLIDMARQRVSTILIGTSLCFITSMLICPIWAGDELHNLTHRNIDKLASSLEGCIADYFKGDSCDDNSKRDSSKEIQAYKCVLNSKPTEESMANFARWEPAHGHFSFRHPWKGYLKIGSLIRNCAYCIHTMTNCTNSEMQAPEFLKRQLQKPCMELCSRTSRLLKELAIMMKTMTRSSKLDFCLQEMNFAAQELQDALRSLPIKPEPMLRPAEDINHEKPETMAASHGPPLLEVLPLVTLVSLLIETAARIEDLIGGVVELSETAAFKAPKLEKKPNQNQASKHHTIEIQYDTVKAPPRA
ncbi:hypothetical protein SAY86_019618 [Trapa natans]|uniref:Aluminum-activated malate transporter 10 n=1 Tax=Trapa natans TaxID=22666 RepID=A0AAN7R139_TRANT|nr:hypothetical protein SAY86_019618 [Trapa natans]